MLPTTFQAFAERNPDAHALSFNGQRFTYGALNEAVERLRGSLAMRGIEKGDTVAILLPNSPHFIISHLAVLGLGAISVPIHAQSKAREIASLIEDAGACALIAWSNLAAESERASSRSESLRLRIYLGDSLPAGSESLVDLISGGEPLACDSSLSAEDPCAVLYSAGTSGFPRGAEFTHGNLAEHSAEMGRMLRIRDTDRFLNALPFSTAAGLTMGVHLPLYHGSAIEIHSRFHPGDTLKCLHDNQTTVFVANPSAYAVMAAFPTAEKSDLSRLRYALALEAKLPEMVARDTEDKLKIRIFEGYGTSESGGAITLNLFPALTPRGSVGQALPGQELTVFGNDGQTAPSGVVGQIALRGPAMMSRYRNRPDKTKQATRDGWFLTDDRGYVDDQCNLFITGHSSEVIVKGGFPVCCREVEEIVEGLPHIQDVAVVGVPDPVFGEEIKACVVLKDGASIGPSEIIEYVKERIAVYKCPKIVKLYKELPRAPGGKIIRGQLKDEKS
jgi:long-chain acyl-CoA synthetase